MTWFEEFLMTLLALPLGCGAAYLLCRWLEKRLLGDKPLELD